mmetsp:Transcript_7033/g.15376  ORF Transcript_7033/g.15376 Transcript_7033/m.15376 type:complete len:270 (+) Transcript_7033:137-946(+)
MGPILFSSWRESPTCVLNPIATPSHNRHRTVMVLLLGCGEHGLEGALQLLVGLHDALHLLRVHLLLRLPPFHAAGQGAVDSAFQALHLLHEFSLAGSQLPQLLVQVDSLLLCHEGLPHPIGDGGLIERLVGGDGHARLVPHTQQQQPPLRAVDGYLPDQLIEALRVELLSNGAYTRFPGLPGLQLVVKLLLQVYHVEASGGRARHVLDPQLPVFCPLSWGQNRIQYILCLRGGLLHSWLLLAFLSLGICDTHQNWRVILDERGSLHFSE